MKRDMTSTDRGNEMGKADSRSWIIASSRILLTPCKTNGAKRAQATYIYQYGSSGSFAIVCGATLIRLAQPQGLPYADGGNCYIARISLVLLKFDAQ